MNAHEKIALSTMLANPEFYLEQRASARMDTIIENSDTTDAFYFVGFGHDFDQASLPDILSFEHRLAGVSCIWTRLERYGLPNGMRLFDLKWSYVETPISAAPVAVLCQTILADEMEAVVAVSTIWEKVKPSKIIVLSEFANRAVVRNLKIFARSNAIDIAPLSGFVVDMDLRDVRGNLEKILDQREERYAPLLSTWLAERGFGPDPKPEKRSSLQRKMR